MEEHSKAIISNCLDPNLDVAVALPGSICWQLGSKAWEFATPLLLLQFNPENIFAPVAFGLITNSVQPFFGPVIGGWADKASSRLTTVFWGCGVQGATSILAVGLLSVLLSLGPDAALSGPAALGGLSSSALVIFLLLAALGICEGLAAGAVSVAVTKDWVPSVFERPSAPSSDELTAVNALMSRVDLVAEFCGPVLAGLALAAYGPNRPLEVREAALRRHCDPRPSSLPHLLCLQWPHLPLSLGRLVPTWAAGLACCLSRASIPGPGRRLLTLPFPVLLPGLCINRPLQRPEFRAAVRAPQEPPRRLPPPPALPRVRCRCRERCRWRRR